MTPDEADARLAQGGPITWGELQALVLARLWAGTCGHRHATGQPLPPDHLRPALADPHPQPSKGDTLS